MEKHGCETFIPDDGYLARIQVAARRRIIFHTRRPTGVKKEIATDGSRRFTLVDGSIGPNVGLSSTGNYKEIKRLSRSSEKCSRGYRADQIGSSGGEDTGISADRSCDRQQRSRRAESLFTRTRRIAIVAAIVAAGLIGFFAAGKISNQHSGVVASSTLEERPERSLPPAITSTPAEERDGVWQVPAKAGLPGLSVTESQINATEVDQRAGDDGLHQGKSLPRSNYADNSGKVSLHPAAGESSTSNSDLSSLATFFDAVRQVESAGQAAAVGDGGRSLGAYQIQRDYWLDACEAGGVDWIWRETVLSAAHSEQIMRWYFQRYCPGPLQRITACEPLVGDFEQLARTHNGGPAGPNKQSTLRYWRRIRAVMAQEANPKNG